MRAFKLQQTPSTDETIQTKSGIDRNDANYECDEDGLLWRLCLRDAAAKLEPDCKASSSSPVMITARSGNG